MSDSAVNSDSKIEELITGSNYKLVASGLNGVSLVSEIVGALKSNKKSGTMIVSLIGGAASGKSTLSVKLAGSLGESDVISTDDYVVGDREYRRKHFEGKDHVSKYDPEFLNQKVKEVCSLVPGKKVKVPTYDKVTGLAIAAGEENYQREIGKVDFLIVEGDFDFVENPNYKIYYHVPTEVRLENRIQRDKETRNEPSIDNIIKNFQLRQKLQHETHTLPAASTADMLIIASAERKVDGFTYTYFVYKKLD